MAYKSSVVLSLLLVLVDPMTQARSADIKRDCDDCPRMVAVPPSPGIFTVGNPDWSAACLVPDKCPGYWDEGPQHQAIIGEPFKVSETPITIAQFQIFADDTHFTGGECLGPRWMGAPLPGSSWKKPMELDPATGLVSTFGTDLNEPVVCVSWHDAQMYLAWLRRKTGLTYRLLTETEWEYAAGAGQTRRYPWSKPSDMSLDIPAGMANCGDVKDDCQIRPPRHIMPVGQFFVNEFGLQDMVGNAWTWLQDCRGGDDQNIVASDNLGNLPRDGAPLVTSSCSNKRALRGGCWGCPRDDLRISRRHYGATDQRDATDGLRIARDLTPDERRSFILGR